MNHPDWQVTVQAPQVLEAGEVIPLVVPGYVQVDDVSGGVNRWSASPERLRQRGFEVPDFSALPSGRYRFEEAVEMVRDLAGQDRANIKQEAA